MNESVKMHAKRCELQGIITSFIKMRNSDMIKKHYPTRFSVNSDSWQVKTFISIQVCYLSDNTEIKARPYQRIYTCI